MATFQHLKFTQYEGGLKVSDSIGPPQFSAHKIGEIYTDSIGTIYTCTKSGTPGTWGYLQLTPITLTQGSGTVLAIRSVGGSGLLVNGSNVSNNKLAISLYSGANIPIVSSITYTDSSINWLVADITNPTALPANTTHSTSAVFNYLLSPASVNLTAGVYHANLTHSAGTYGSITTTLILTVTPPPRAVLRDAFNRSNNTPLATADLGTWVTTADLNPAGIIPVTFNNQATHPSSDTSGNPMYAGTDVGQNNCYIQGNLGNLNSDQGFFFRFDPASQSGWCVYYYPSYNSLVIGEISYGSIYLRRVLGTIATTDLIRVECITNLITVYQNNQVIATYSRSFQNDTNATWAGIVNGLLAFSTGVWDNVEIGTL